MSSIFLEISHASDFDPEEVKEYSTGQDDEEKEAKRIVNREHATRVELIPIYLEIFTGIGIIWLVFIAAIICLNGEANLQGKTYVKENTTIELIRTI